MTGKITHLPPEIREQVNHRLEQGETNKTILPWLNSLPEVQAVLTEISWLGGGFRFFSGSARCNWLQIKAGLSQIRQVETYPLHKAL